MSQRSVSNTSESKLPNLHSFNNCWCAIDCGLTVGVYLSCACGCHVGFGRWVIFKSNFRLLQLTWKYLSSFRTVTCVVLFGLTLCNSKCFCSKFINFLACYLHSQKCQYWVLDSNQLILSTIVELKGMSDCPCYWSHLPKNLLSVGWRYYSRKKTDCYFWLGKTFLKPKKRLSFIDY